MLSRWYPGHMKKARREIAEAMPTKDVLIEVVDARMPASSSNPDLDQLRKGKPCVKVLSKSDLADPNVTALWLRHFETQAHAGKLVPLALTTNRAAEARARIFELCKELAPHRLGPGKGVRTMVVGIPNVGKSTLINTLVQRKVTKVGDEPAVTKAQQIVTLENGIIIWDNAGIMWPRVDDDATIRLALGGAMPDVAIDYESVGLFAAELFLARYPELLRTRFKLGELPASATLLLEAIGRKYGGLRRGGQVDFHKAADVLIHEFRSGKLGKITLETPSDLPTTPLGDETAPQEGSEDE